MDKKKPAAADALVERGDMLFKKGLVGEAQKQWTQALELDPHHLDAHYHLGQSYLLQGDDRVEQEFRCFGWILARAEPQDSRIYRGSIQPSGGFPTPRA